MALRVVRDPGFRRAALGGPGFVALALALFLAAGVVATWPALRDARTSFLAVGLPGHGEAAPGDHLQTGYQLWLPGHQLERGRIPWRDPYSFRPESPPRLNPAWWPFGLPYWPLVAAFGPVVAWNLFVLLGFAGAGGLACGWLRELGLTRGAALVGGLVFALAPYRVAQSADHLLGFAPMLLPAALWALERARRGSLWWLVPADAAIASIPLSGQVHLALGAIPFFAAYALARSREPRFLAGAGVGVAAAIGGGLLVDHAVIERSIGAGGRSFDSVRRYSAHWLDLVRRRVGHERERFVFLGWLTPVLALVGLVLLAVRRRALALLLGLGALVPILLALGSTLPTYRPLWHAIGPLHQTRVPERLLPIACLCIAALVAFAAERLRAAPLLALLVVALAADLRVGAFEPTSADPGNAAYAALRAEPADGTFLELPVVRPSRQEGSVYQYYAMQAPRPRLAGYSTVAPRAADEVLRALRPVSCGRRGATLPRLVALHLGRYVDNPFFSERCAQRALALLRRLGYRELAADGRVKLYGRG